MMVTVRLPMRRRTVTRPLPTALSTGKDLGTVGRSRIVEGHRAVGRAVDELAHERILRGAHLARSSLRDDPSFRHDIEVVDDLERLVDVCLLYTSDAADE